MPKIPDSLRPLFALLLSVACCAQELPDPTLTPGAALAVPLGRMCAYGYTATVRHVPIAEKKEVYRRYRLAYVPRTYEVDHLIPLALGGSNAIENLWPEPYAGEWNAGRKDALERRLAQMVCSGEMPLEKAQRMIAWNWIEAYQIVFSGSRRRRR